MVQSHWLRASFKRLVWRTLEGPKTGDRLGRRFDRSMIGLILLSVTGVVLRTVPSNLADTPWTLVAIESGTVAIFSIEILLRLWVADLGGAGARRPRLAYLTSAEGLIDMVAVVPFYLQLLMPEWNPAYAGVLLLRVLKLVRYSPALETLIAVIAQERKALVGALTVIFVLLLLSSSVIYLVERAAQPGAFGSIPASMWWSVTTLTTVGYGDVTPITPIGKLFGAVVALLGVGMIALPAGILSNGFAKELRQRRFLRTAELVTGVPLFAGLSVPDVAQISRMLELLVVQAGQSVVVKGERASSMFFVVDGALELEIDGHREPLRGDFFGEIALLEGGTRSATVRSLTRCQLLELDATHFEQLMAKNSRIESSVRRVAEERLRADEARAERKAELP
jgi:voltage-gated potassium channel